VNQLVGEAFQAEHLLLAVAQTPIHAGAGPSTQPLDLPVQRSAISGFPLLRGSELRGSLAQQLFERYKGFHLWKRLIELVFGFAGEKARAGSFDVLDAHILLFPVPSLYGVYAYVTCPLLLYHFSLRASKVAIDLAKVAGELAESHSKMLSEHKVVVEKESSIVGEDGTVYLHPLLRFKVERDKRLDNLSNLLAGRLESLGLEVRGHLALLDDDPASYTIRHSMIPQPRVRLDYKTKTVSTGLWQEELVPRYTIFHTSIIIPKGKRFYLEVSRKEGSELERLVTEPRLSTLELTKAEGDRVWRLEFKPSKLLEFLLPNGKTSLFLGGDITVGRGLLRLVRVG